MTKIKIGDTIRVVKINLALAPTWYTDFIGKEFSVNGQCSNGVSVEENSDAFFYFDEIELVQPVKSMFDFGPYNHESKNVLLSYLDDEQETGLCNYIENINDEHLDNFVTSQSVFEGASYQENFPIEAAILKKNHKLVEYDSCLSAYARQYDKKDFVSVKTPYGRLRRWWAYNLAVAISQQELVKSEPIVEEPQFDSSIILTAEINSKIVLDGVEFVLMANIDGDVYLSTNIPIEGFEPLAYTYPYLHVRDNKMFAVFSRQELKNLIDSKQYKIC